MFFFVSAVACNGTANLLWDKSIMMKKGKGRSKKYKGYKGRYARKRKTERLEGVMMRKRDGYGFVTPDTGEKEIRSDVYIPERFMKNAMNGDRVLIELNSSIFSTKSPEGKVVKIIEHSVSEVAGYLHHHDGVHWLEPIRKDGGDRIVLNRKNLAGGRSGDAVLVEIVRYADGVFPAEGAVRTIIARKGEPGADIKCIAAAHGFSLHFPSAVLDEIEKLRPHAACGDFEKDASPQDFKGRRDIRSRILFTIDGADSKDFDDAVSISRLQNGHYLLGVHIADVSHYVRSGTAIYEEAKRRANSVYLINQVLPMLPPQLSNGLCSLNPNVDRLALSVDMEIDKSGKILGGEIYESVINSSARLVYSDVSDFLEGKSKACASAEVDAALLLMKELYMILAKASEKRGSLDFDLPESKILLDDSGDVISVAKAERRIANRLIEEFMIAANQTVAERFFERRVPFVYRVHEKPELQKMLEFKTFIQGLGYSLKGEMNNMRPIFLLELLNKIKGSEYESVVSMMMLRSMKKAYYDVECLGHFGLSLEFYAHFTSPIRRFPDLFIHKIIKECIAAQSPDLREVMTKRNAAEAGDVAEISSASEQRTQELERDVEKYKMVEYMSQFVGDDFDGVISGVTQFGIFVQLENSIEGMIALSNITDDYYIFQAERGRLVGENSSRIFAFGDRISVKLISTNLENREINFVLAE